MGGPRTSTGGPCRSSTHTTGPFPGALRPLPIARAFVRLVRLVWHVRPALVHLHTPAAALPARLLPSSLWPPGTKIAYTVHGFSHQWPPRGRGETAVQRLEQYLSRRTDLILFQSQEDLEEASARRYAGPLVLLGNGVQDEWFDLPDVVRRRGTDLRSLLVGRLVREKGILDLLAAIENLEGVQLDIVGDALVSDRDGVAAEGSRRTAGVRGRQAARHAASRRSPGPLGGDPRAVPA
ncbi:glycosyltransferase [Geodermatophilus sp. SYSU D00815]